MLTIACLSQKGGVGKSTLSRLIARTYAAAEWAVKIGDFNVKQKTCVEWSAIRLQMEIDPAVPAEAFGNVRSALQDSARYNLMVFDGKPDSDTGTLELAKEANLILVPTAPTQDDLIPQIKFAHELRSRGINTQKILFVLNRTESDTWTRLAREFLHETGYRIAETEIPSRPGYQSAQNMGRAISETNFNSLNDRAEQLAQEVVTRLTQLTEH